MHKIDFYTYIIVKCYTNYFAFSFALTLIRIDESTVQLQGVPHSSFSYNYRPQMKFAKVMFLHLSVSHSVQREGICLSACWDTHPLGSRHFPWEADTPLGSRHPPGKQTLLQEAAPPEADTPWEVDTPHCAVHAGR